jgi:hypothetical protein
LNGEEVTIPEGCILIYSGGSIANGQIVYTNTLIEGEERLIAVETSGNSRYAIINADEEDLSIVNGRTLKLKNKEYIPEQYSGLGRVYLRKNIVNGKNILVQDMINKLNTIYIIQYDFDLQGAEITIPEGCVLKFEGGSIKNATLIGNNTGIYASEKDVIFYGVTISGTWEIKDIYAGWFGEINNANVVHQLFNLCSSYIHNNIYINENVHCYVESETEDSGIKPKSSTTIVLDGTIELVANSARKSRIINLFNVQDVIICGKGKIIGDRDAHQGTDGEWQHGIWCEGASNITIDGITVTKCMGDGISIGGNTNTNYNITIKNCTISQARRTGVSVANVKFVTLCNNAIIDNYGGWDSGVDQVESGIDVELNLEDTRVIENVVIENNYITGKNGIYVTSTEKNKGPVNTLLKSNIINVTNIGIATRCSVHTTIENNTITSNNYALSLNAGNSSQQNFPNATYFIMNNVLSGKVTGNTVGVFCSNYIIGSTYFEGTSNSQYLQFKNNIVKGNFKTISPYSYIDNNIFELSFFTNTDCVVINNTIKGKVERLGNNTLCNNNVFDINISESLESAIVFEKNVVFSNNKVQLKGNITPSGYFKVLSNATISNNFIKSENEPTYMVIASTSNYKSCVFSNNTISKYFSDLNNCKVLTYINPTKGTTEQRPTIVSDGIEYYDTTIRRPIYWNASRGAWVNADGYAAGVRSGITQRRTELTEYLVGLDTGLQFFDSTLGKTVVWDGTTWINVDGSVLE